MADPFLRATTPLDPLAPKRRGKEATPKACQGLSAALDWSVKGGRLAQPLKAL